MKLSLTLLPGAVLLIAGCTTTVVAPPGPPLPPGPAVAVAVEDRPYYVRGPYYVEGGRHYVWVSGHWAHRHGHRVWIHGHYVLR
jgi:hypothetical protein